MQWQSLVKKLFPDNDNPFIPFSLYVSPTLIAPHHGKVDLDGRPRDVGVYEGSTMIILKWGSTGEVSNFFSYPQAGCTLFTEYTHLGDKVEGELKLSPACK